MSAWDKQEGGNHYKGMVIQPMEFALKNGLDYAQANVIKYVCRHAAKNGKQDLLKAIHNIELMIEHYYGAESAPETPQAILDAQPSKDIPMEEKCCTEQKRRIDAVDQFLYRLKKTRFMNNANMELRNRIASDLEAALRGESK